MRKKVILYFQIFKFKSERVEEENIFALKKKKIVFQRKKNFNNTCKDNSKKINVKKIHNNFF